MKRSAISFSVNLDTDGPTEVVLDIPWSFRPDRLSLEIPPWPFWSWLVAHAIHVPKVALRTIAVAFHLLFSRRDEDTDPPDPEDYPDYVPPSPWPSFRPPQPGPPVIIMNISVGKASLLRESVPADLFKEESSLPSQNVTPDSKITLTVRRTCAEPYVLRGCFLGSVVE